jgi:hypothetical protein
VFRKLEIGDAPSFCKFPFAMAALAVDSAAGRFEKIGQHSLSKSLEARR